MTKSEILWLLSFIIIAYFFYGLLKKQIDRPIISTCGIYESCELYGGTLIVEDTRVLCIKNKEK